ncbi:MAG: GerMN domain-containing protein [Candidatus Peregrinibacteria bacterium]
MKKLSAVMLSVLVLVSAGCKSTVNKPADDLNSSDSDASINISTPADGSEVTSPILITGEATGLWFFEGSFSVSLVDSSGEKLADETVIYADSDWMSMDFVPFHGEVVYSITDAKKDAKLIFNANNPSDLPENGNTFEIPVVLTNNSAGPQTETTSFYVYFTNSQKNPDSVDCSKVYPVVRTVPHTSAVAQAALEELLNGPTSAEMADGYSTTINDNVTLNSISIENGVASADFDSQLGYQVGGSCRVAAIRSQIDHTLLQFPTVDNIVVSIDGNSEDILQP